MACVAIVHIWLDTDDSIWLDTTDNVWFDCAVGILAIVLGADVRIIAFNADFRQKLLFADNRRAVFTREGG